MMKDDHLRNTLNLMGRKLLDFIPDVEDSQMTDYHKELYEVQDTTPADLGKAIRLAIRNMYPYLAEAFYRDLDGLEEVRDALKQVLGRDALPTKPLPNLLGGRSR